MLSHFRIHFPPILFVAFLYQIFIILDPISLPPFGSSYITLSL